MVKMLTYLRLRRDCLMNSSICWIIFGMMFLMASAGAVDGTAEPIWVVVNGIIGLLLMCVGIMKQED